MPDRDRTGCEYTKGAPARKRGDDGLSIIVPCFNEAKNLPGVHARLVDDRKKTAEQLRPAGRGRLYR